MQPFVRKFDGKLDPKDPLFQRLLPDIIEDRKGTFRNTDVFPAVRKGEIDFYYRGGKVFSHDGTRFSTHVKYASVIPYAKGDYISQDDLGQLPQIKSFTDRFEGRCAVDVYQRIKDNCAARWRGTEARSVSYLYNHACTKLTQSRIVVLDVQVSLERNDEVVDAPDSEINSKRKRARQDIIDLVLLDKESGEMRFFEAKLLTNNELVEKQNGQTKVLNQIEKYAKQLREREAELVEQYRNHLSILQKLFGKHVPNPKRLRVHLEPCLYICGFDSEQKDGIVRPLKEALKKERSGLQIYAKGDPTDVTLENLWNGN